jgi:hypothetical protein
MNSCVFVWVWGLRRVIIARYSLSGEDLSEVKI